MFMKNYGQYSLYKLIKMSQFGDSDSLLKVINRFDPLIKKFARKLDYEEAETDLVISFIQIIKIVNLSKFSKRLEGALVKYICNSLTNRCVDLFRKYVFNKNKELELNLDIIQSEIDIDSKMFIDDLLNLSILTSQQRLILKQSYISEYSDAEIAEMLNISRQAINKTKNRGLQAIRNHLALFNILIYSLILI